MNNTGTKRVCVRGPRSQSALHVLVDDAGVFRVGQDLQRGGRRGDRDLKSSTSKIDVPLAAASRRRRREGVGEREEVEEPPLRLRWVSLCPASCDLLSA